MRVPPIDTFGRFGVPKNSKNQNKNQSTELIKPIKNDTVSFSSTAKYLKKYLTLPDEIKEVLSPTDAIDMFKDMEWLAQGKVERGIIGKGKNTELFDNPWLDDYYLLVVKNPRDEEEKIIVYSDENMYDSVWQDKDNKGIQLIKKVS